MLASAILSGAAKVYFGFQYLPLFLDGLLLFLVGTAIGQRMLVPRTAVVLAVALLFIVGVIQVFNTYVDDMLFKLKGFRLSAFYMLAFFIPFSEVFTPRRLRRLSVVFVVVGMVCALFAVKQWMYPNSAELAYAALEGVGSKFYGDPYYRPHNAFRVFGSAISSTHLAALMLLSMAIAMSYLSQVRPVSRVHAWGLLLCSCALLLTFSRTAILAGVVLILYVVYAYVVLTPRARTGQKFVALMLVVVVLTLATVMTYAVPLLRARVLTLQSIGEVSAFLSRLDLWSDRLRDIAVAPFGYGTGVAGFHETGNYFLIADNQFLKVFIEWGWIAGVVFTVLVGTVLLRSSRIPSYSETARIWTIAINGSAIALVPLMATGQILEAYPVNLIFWYLIGLREVLGRGVLVSLSGSKDMSMATQSPSVHE